ncbi:MAG TPA: hypothetical protein VF656_06295 [Pyrinomonadaceae bacterium]|jgi:hypothetical protein
MYKEIDTKARRAKTGEEVAINELVDAILKNFAAVLPADTAQAVKVRLVRAELKYRQNKKGIRESRIVKAINQLAEAFEAPEYAQTSPLQVRLLRVDLKSDLPNLVDAEIEEVGLKKKAGDKLKVEISPIEATVLTIVMVQQKMLNPDWQLTPREYSEKLRRQPYQPAAASPQGSKEYRLEVDQRDRRKSRDMMTLVSHKVRRLSPTSLTALLDASLNTLNIK